MGVIWADSGVTFLNVEGDTIRSPAYIMAVYIINYLEKMSWPSSSLDWPLFVSHLPESRDDCGAVYDTAGKMDLRSMNGTTYIHPGIQLRIQSKDYETAYEKIEDIAGALDQVNNVVVQVGDLQYEIQNVSRTSPIVALGVEPGTMRRFSFTVNFLLSIREL